MAHSCSVHCRATLSASALLTLCERNRGFEPPALLVATPGVIVAVYQQELGLTPVASTHSKPQQLLAFLLSGYSLSMGKSELRMRSICYPRHEVCFFVSRGVYERH